MIFFFLQGAKRSLVCEKQKSPQKTSMTKKKNNKEYNENKKHKDVLKSNMLSHQPPLSPALSRAAYYSVLIYKALNVILHVQVKGRE